MGVNADKAWHTQAPEAVGAALRFQYERGLSPEEAARRLEEEGPNELKDQPPRALNLGIYGQLLSKRVQVFLPLTVRSR
jgi:hypothetical protein